MKTLTRKKQSLSEKLDHRLAQYAQLGNIMGMCGHLFLAGVFYYLHVKEMLLFNLFFSVPAFAFAYYLNTQGRYNIAFVFAIGELYLHQILATYHLGIQSGFYLFFVYLVAFVFFNHRWDLKIQVPFIGVTLLTLHVMLDYSMNNQPLYQLEPNVLEALHDTCITMLAVMLAVLVRFFAKSANRNEKVLEAMVAKRTRNFLNAQKDAISMIGEAAHQNDSETGMHIWRMADYAALLAQKYGLEAKEVALIKQAAPMHDSGKIGIPDAVLKKPAGLEEDEWDVMRKHTTIGHKILSKGQTKLFKVAATIALTHHEKWDGSGYPQGLSGENIPLYGRIVALADVFDALTMQRQYKKAWSVKEALEEIKKGKGTHFDPNLVDIFVAQEEELTKIKTYWHKKDNQA